MLQTGWVTQQKVEYLWDEATPTGYIIKVFRVKIEKIYCTNDDDERHLHRVGIEMDGEE